MDKKKENERLKRILIKRMSNKRKDRPSQWLRKEMSKSLHLHIEKRGVEDS